MVVAAGAGAGARAGAGAGAGARARGSGGAGAAPARAVWELEERAERAETALSALQQELGNLREAWAAERAETREALRVANAAIEESIACMGTSESSSLTCDVEHILQQLPAAGAAAVGALDSIADAELEGESELQKMERQIRALRVGLADNEERTADARLLLSAYEEAYKAAYEVSLG